MERIGDAFRSMADKPPPNLGLGNLGGRSAQIISSTPVSGGVGSYGTVLKILAIVAIVFIAIPLIKVFKHFYSYFQTHYQMMEDIRGNLGENRLEALKKVLPEREWEPIDIHIDESVYREEYSRIHQFAEENGIEVEELEQLAERAKGHRNLERFLIKDGAFGEDPESPKFKAGMEIVRFYIGRIYDTSVLHELNQIARAIEEAPKEGLEGYLQKEVRERLDRLHQSTIYRILNQREGRSNHVVRMIQDLSVVIRLDSHGIEQLRALGSDYLAIVEKERGAIPEENQATYLADALDDVIGKHHWSYKIESLFDKLLVWVRYPEKTSMAARSHSADTALDYNSYQVGNHDMAYGDYSLAGHPIRAIHGPTPTSDHLLQAQLDAQRATGGIHLQHNLEHPAFSTGDLVRTQYLMSVERDYPETFRLMSTPLDGPGWSLKGEAGEYFMDYETVEGFFLKYGTFAFANRKEDPAASFDELEGSSHRTMEGRGDNGFYVGPRVMSDQQFRLAFIYASKAFSHVEPEQEEHRKRLTKALQVGVQGFIAVGALIQTLKDAYPDAEEEQLQELVFKASFGQACKLDIDRGVVLNVMTRVYFQMAAGKKLTEEDISEIIGTVVGRAELVSGRTIISDRYQPLSDALRLIGDNQENVQSALQDYIRDGFGVDPRVLDYQSSS